MTVQEALGGLIPKDGIVVELYVDEDEQARVVISTKTIEKVLAPIIERALRAAYNEGFDEGLTHTTFRASDAGVAAGAAAMSTNSGEVVNELVVEPTEGMVEAGMDAAKAERWIFATDAALRTVIRAVLDAALTARKGG